VGRASVRLVGSKPGLQQGGMLKQLAGQSVLVLGLGETGLSLARYLREQGAHLRLADSRIDPPGVATLRSEMPQVEIHCGTFTDELLQGD